MQLKKLEKKVFYDIIRQKLNEEKRLKREVFMKQKDYYAILGVNKKTTLEEIKVKYRKLAKSLHPDANIDDPYAEEKFKDLNAAYDTLTNKDKRKKYDRQVIRYGYGTIKDENKSKEIKYEVKPSSVIVGEIINTILGLGQDAKKMVLSTAEEIKTKIDSQKVPKKGKNIEANLEITIEEGFFGVEKRISIGSKENKKNYSVNIPRGIKNLEKIRLAALGEMGKNGGKSGDLIITIKQKEEKDMKLNRKRYLFKC